MQWHSSVRRHEALEFVEPVLDKIDFPRCRLDGDFLNRKPLAVGRERVGPTTMRWAVTFEDPTTWTQPWTAVMLVQQSDDAIFEYACHEGNYAMEGILAGARAAQTEQ